LSTDLDARLLEDGLAEIGVTAGVREQEKLLELLRLVYVWNRSAGLTTIPAHDAVRLHLLDSLLALPFLSGDSAVDLGTGGGFPGLPLAIVRPDIRWLLVESNRRRCSFLMEAARVLGLSSVTVHEGDAGQATGSFPTVISRAFRHPPEFLDIAGRWLAERGRIVCMMADASNEELDALAASAALLLGPVLRRTLPGGGEPRVVVGFSRLGG
jgi:16S rRNA (guanine527-N7)-methyltransferase